MFSIFLCLFVFVLLYHSLSLSFLLSLCHPSLSLSHASNCSVSLFLGGGYLFFFSLSLSFNLFSSLSPFLVSLLSLPLLSLSLSLSLSLFPSPLSVFFVCFFCFLSLLALSVRIVPLHVFPHSLLSISFYLSLPSLSVRRSPLSLNLSIVPLHLCLSLSAMLHQSSTLRLCAPLSISLFLLIFPAVSPRHPPPCLCDTTIETERQKQRQ